MSKVTQDSNLDRLTEPAEQMRFLSIFCDNITRLLNNGLRFSDNFDAKIVNITFSASSTDTRIAHGLDRIPQGYLILTRSANMVVYDGSAASTSSNIYLRSSAVGSVSALIF